jgi:hypothetical protein
LRGEGEVAPCKLGLKLHPGCQNPIVGLARMRGAVEVKFLNTSHVQYRHAFLKKVAGREIIFGVPSCFERGALFLKV